MLFPKLFIVTSSDPEIEVCEVHVAEQELELVDVHEKVEVLPSGKEVGSATRLTVGNGLEPLPPHEAIITVVKIINLILFMYFNYT